MEETYTKKEWVIAIIAVLLLLVAAFFTGYFIGKTENRIPIIIEKCSDVETP
jgi:hypothetical protein